MLTLWELDLSRKRLSPTRTTCSADVSVHAAQAALASSALLLPLLSGGLPHRHQVHVAQALLARSVALTAHSDGQETITLVHFHLKIHLKMVFPQGEFPKQETKRTLTMPEAKHRSTQQLTSQSSTQRQVPKHLAPG